MRGDAAGTTMRAARKGMRMYNWLEGDAEIELLIEDVTPEAVFAEALLALGDALSEATHGTPVTHEVALSAEDLPALLAAWMNELVNLAERDGFKPERVEKLRIEGSSLRARVAGERSIPQSEIKAVTYHGVEMKRLDDGAWAARVTLDE